MQGATVEKELHFNTEDKDCCDIQGSLHQQKRGTTNTVTFPPQTSSPIVTRHLPLDSTRLWHPSILVVTES